MIKCCPSCGQTLPRPVPTFYLPPTQERIFNLLHRAGIHGITPADLFDMIYANVPRPPDINALYALRICINRRIAPIGKRIVYEHGTYRIKDIPAAPYQMKARPGRGAQAKLTDVQVRRLRADKRTLRQMSGDFHISPGEASKIRNGLYYKDVQS